MARPAPPIPLDFECAWEGAREKDETRLAETREWILEMWTFSSSLLVNVTRFLFYSSPVHISTWIYLEVFLWPKIAKQKRSTPTSSCPVRGRKIADNILKVIAFAFNERRMESPGLDDAVANWTVNHRNWFLWCFNAILLMLLLKPSIIARVSRDTTPTCSLRLFLGLASNFFWHKKPSTRPWSEH